MTDVFIINFFKGLFLYFRVHFEILVYPNIVPNKKSLFENLHTNWVHTAAVVMQYSMQYCKKVIF